MWQTTNAAALNTATAPYLTFTLVNSSANTIDFDRFVIHALAAFTTNVKMQLRWSIDSFGSSLGEFTVPASSYALSSVDLSSLASTAATSIEFRIYYYNAATYVFHSTSSSYPTTDSTPSSYNLLAAFSIWKDPVVLSTDENETSLKINTSITNHHILVTGITETEKYSIYNILGKEVLVGNIQNNQNISIESLTEGVYVLKLNNKKIKFVKN